MPRWIFERAATPIYQRIAEALMDAFAAHGEQTNLLDPEQCASPDAFVGAVNDSGADFCVVTNSYGALSIPYGEQTLFERVAPKLVFVHHDNPFSGFCDYARTLRHIQALVRQRQRSVHLCIEPAVVRDLQRMGIEHAHVIHHASEFVPPAQPPEARFAVSFVGHVVPSDALPYGDDDTGRSLRRDFQHRLMRFDAHLDPSAEQAADLACPAGRLSQEWFAAKHYYRSLQHMASLPFRGGVLASLAEGVQLDIVGGDPAYRRGTGTMKEIPHAKVRYHTATTDYRDTCGIYAQSRISINLTALGFDAALVNRVIDVAAAGGFVLTDWKDELGRLLSVADEISFRTSEELTDKVQYYLAHERERRDLARVVHEELAAKCSYASVVERITDAVRQTSA